MRHQVKILVDFYNPSKQGLGAGSAPRFWTEKTDVANLTQGQQILDKVGFESPQISPNDLVQWCDLENCVIAKGPKAENRRVTKGWKDSLIIIYEILLSHLQLNSEDHWNSDVELVSPSPKKPRVVERLREVRILDQPLDLECGQQTSSVATKRAAPSVARMFNFCNPSSDEEETFTQDKEKRYGLVVDRRGNQQTAPSKSTTGTKSTASSKLTAPSSCKSSAFSKSTAPSSCKSTVSSMSTGSSKSTAPASKSTETVSSRSTTSAAKELFEKEGGLQPILSEWFKYRLFDEDTLSDYSHGCKLQVVDISSSDEGFVIKLHDTEFEIEARLNPRCKTHIPFLKRGSIIKVLITHGGVNNLSIVSFFIF